MDRTVPRTTDRIEKELICGYERYPALENVGIKTWGTGPSPFRPMAIRWSDRCQAKRGYWSVCVMSFLQGGGVGKTLAEWMIHGEPEADAWPMDVARYGDFAQNKRYIERPPASSTHVVSSCPINETPGRT